MRDDNGGFSVAAIGGWVLFGVLGLVGLTVVFGSWYTVNQTERGVLLRNGATVGIASPGLGFKLPIIDTVEKVSVTTATHPWKKMDTYSYDQQQAFLDVSVTLRAAPEKVDKLYALYGGLEGAINQLLSPIVNQQVKIVFGQYTAVRAIQTREKLNADIGQSVRHALGQADVFVVESVQLENIEFSKAYLTSIEQRMLAEVEVQRLQQNAEREKVQAQITVTQANATADSTRAAAKAAADNAVIQATANAKSVELNAQANAMAITLRGNAEATAISARAKALGENPQLVMLTQAERWNGALPVTMIPGGSVPMLALSK